MPIETRSLLSSLAATDRGFAFWLADLIGSKSGAEGDSNYSTIGVTRASTRTVYSVPRADINSRANASVGQGHTR